MSSYADLALCNILCSSVFTNICRILFFFSFVKEISRKVFLLLGSSRDIVNINQSYPYQHRAITNSPDVLAFWWLGNRWLESAWHRNHEIALITRVSRQSNVKAVMFTAIRCAPQCRLTKARPIIFLILNAAHIDIMSLVYVAFP